MAVGRGTLSLNYSYRDAIGTYNVGSFNVDYAATTDDNVVGTAAPTGQIHSIVGDGGQAVTVTFTTDDGRPATALQLTTSLASLPAGWTSTGTGFECSGLSTGNGCQLGLMYVPSAADSGTLLLSYTYKNNAGKSKSGSVNIQYRATTDDNVVATAGPSVLNNVMVGSSTAVGITFTTDDGNPASGLLITSGLDLLPTGWSAGSSNFGCSSVSVGTGCQLSLTYAPMAPDTGNLTLGFQYTNNSGITKTGTVMVGYTAVP
jgi:hypothetical protein